MPDPRRTFTNDSLRGGYSPFRNGAYEPPDLPEAEDPFVRPREAPSRFAEERGAGEILAEAQRTLADLDAVPSSAGLDANDLQARAAALSDRQHRPSLRSLTEFVAKPSTPLLVGGMVAPPLAALGTATAAPDILRRLIAPDPDESRTGAAVEGAVFAGAPFAGRALSAVGAGLKGGVRAGKRAAAGVDEFMTGRRATAAAAKTAAERAETQALTTSLRNTGYGPTAIQKVTGVRPSQEVPFASAQQAVDPNQVLRVAREIAEETGVPVETVLKGYGRSGGEGTRQLGPLRSLLSAGETAPRNRLAADVGVRPSLLRAGVNPRDFTNTLGARTTGSGAAGAGPSGLADVAAGNVAPIGTDPQSRLMSQVSALARMLKVKERPFTVDGMF